MAALPPTNMLQGLYEAIDNYRLWPQERGLTLHDMARPIDEYLQQDKLQATNDQPMEKKIQGIFQREANAWVQFLASPREEQEQAAAHEGMPLADFKTEKLLRQIRSENMGEALLGFSRVDQNRALIQEVGTRILNNPRQFSRDIQELREMPGANQGAVSLARFFAEESVLLAERAFLQPPQVVQPQARTRDAVRDFDLTFRQQQGMGVARNAPHAPLSRGTLPVAERGLSSKGFSMVDIWDTAPDAIFDEHNDEWSGDESPGVVWFNSQTPDELKLSQESPMWGPTPPIPAATPPIPHNQGRAPTDEELRAAAPRRAEAKPKEAADLDLN